MRGQAVGVSHPWAETSGAKEGTTMAETATTSAMWLVAIDIGKRFHAVLVEGPDGKRQRFQMASAAENHDRLVSFFRTLAGPVRIALEPTGNLHRTLAYRLLREFLAEGGDLRRFQHHRQFLKYCGLDLAGQPGQSRGRETPPGGGVRSPRGQQYCRPAPRAGGADASRGSTHGSGPHAPRPRGRVVRRRARSALTVRAGARAFLFGLVLILVPPAPGVACEGRGDRGPASPRLGIVLAGGGAKAAYEAGLGLALKERAIVPVVIAGTSAGAINAVILAVGDADRLAALWRTIRREDVFTYRAPTVLGGLLPGWFGMHVLAKARGLLDPAPLRATLARHVDLERVRSAPVAVLVLATDLVSGTAQRFDNATLTLDALVATATVPGLFPPVAAADRLLVDGGVVQRAPVLELLATHAVDRLLVVAAYASEPPAEGTLQAVLERAVELTLSREIERDVELARHRHPQVDVQVLAPSAPLRVRPLDFDGVRLGTLIELGRADAGRCLDALGYAS